MKTPNITIYFFALLIGTCGFFSCENPTENSKAPAKITGSLSLPAAAEGKKWVVLLDDDIDGDNGFVRADSGTCGAAMIVSYTINDPPAGSYYLYAVVFVVSDGSKGPQGGDYLGIYGGSFPDNVPTQPNATVPAAGTASFNITLMAMTPSIKPGTWTATSDFGGFDMVVDSAGANIMEVALKFSNWTCGGVRHNGGITITFPSGRQITDYCFEIKTDLSPDPFEYDPFIINGCFSANGEKADGSWQATVNGRKCSGTWEAAPASG